MASERLIGLINLVATISFSHADLPANDILGHVYEYFLGQFALAGEKGGQYFTPRSIVSLIVEMLEPNQGRVDDPAMGSGKFFVQSERFIEEHGGRRGNLRRRAGEQSDHLAPRRDEHGRPRHRLQSRLEPANSFISNQHPDLRVNHMMATVQRGRATQRQAPLPERGLRRTHSE